MKRNASFAYWIVITSMVIVAGGGYIALGESDEPVAKHEVAVVDISQIFKEHKRFREQLTQMKKDVEAAEAALREDADKIKELKAEAEALEQGEPLKQRLESEITERTLRVQLKMSTQKQGFMDREAEIYYKVYNEIETAVADHCRAHGIRLALRYNKISLDEHSNREQILAGVNRAVVFQDEIDITEAILERVNREPEGGAL